MIALECAILLQSHPMHPPALIPGLYGLRRRVVYVTLYELIAIAAATIVEKTVDEAVTFLFEYPFMNDVMRVVKEEEPEILEQSYDMDCRMTLRIRQSMMPKLRARLEKVETLRFE